MFLRRTAAEHGLLSSRVNQKVPLYRNRNHPPWRRRVETFWPCKQQCFFRLFSLGCLCARLSTPTRNQFPIRLDATLDFPIQANMTAWTNISSSKYVWPIKDLLTCVHPVTKIRCRSHRRELTCYGNVVRGSWKGKSASLVWRRVLLLLSISQWWTTRWKEYTYISANQRLWRRTCVETRDAIDQRTEILRLWLCRQSLSSCIQLLTSRANLTLHTQHFLLQHPQLVFHHEDSHHPQLWEWPEERNWQTQTSAPLPCTVFSACSVSGCRQCQSWLHVMKWMEPCHDCSIKKRAVAWRVTTHIVKALVLYAYPICIRTLQSLSGCPRESKFKKKKKKTKRKRKIDKDKEKKEKNTKDRRQKDKKAKRQKTKDKKRKKTKSQTKKKKCLYLGCREIVDGSCCIRKSWLFSNLSFQSENLLLKLSDNLLHCHRRSGTVKIGDSLLKSPDKAPPAFHRTLKQLFGNETRNDHQTLRSRPPLHQACNVIQRYAPWW